MNLPANASRSIHIALDAADFIDVLSRSVVQRSFPEYLIRARSAYRLSAFQIIHARLHSA